MRMTQNLKRVQLAHYRDSRAVSPSMQVAAQSGDSYAVPEGNLKALESGSDCFGCLELPETGFRVVEDRFGYSDQLVCSPVDLGQRTRLQFVDSSHFRTPSSCWRDCSMRRGDWFQLPPTREDIGEVTVVRRTIAHLWALCYILAQGVVHSYHVNTLAREAAHARPILSNL